MWFFLRLLFFFRIFLMLRSLWSSVGKRLVGEQRQHLTGLWKSLTVSERKREVLKCTQTLAQYISDHPPAIAFSQMLNDGEHGRYGDRTIQLSVRVLEPETPNCALSAVVHELAHDYQYQYCRLFPDGSLIKLYRFPFWHLNPLEIHAATWEWTVCPIRALASFSMHMRPISMLLILIWLIQNRI